MIDILVFGGSKGIGESILIKIDEDNYGIVDSFVDSTSENARALDYLSNNNISFGKVKFLVLTHCHHDHFRGISQIIQNCPNVEFYLSKSIGISSFKLLISAYSKIVASSHNYFREIIDSIKYLKASDRKAKMLSVSSKPIFDQNGVVIQSHSPNSSTDSHLDKLYRKEAKKFLRGNGIKLATSGFNYQSIVLSIESDKQKILLGADQEYHISNNSIGWETIEKLHAFKNKKFDIFKIPHHGSDTGFKNSFWDSILKSKSALFLTPYSRSTLPRASMIKKIKMHGSVYSTLQAKSIYKSLPGRIGKKTKHLNIKRLAKKSPGIIKSSIDAKGVVVVNLTPNAVKL